MGFFDFLAGDPTKKWVREPGLKIEVELRQAELCGVRLGSRSSGLSKLGAPSYSKRAKTGYYSWSDLGIDVFSENDILVGYGFEVNEKERDPGEAYFSGIFLLDGKPLPLGPETRKEDVVRLLGEPWHLYTDPDDDEISLSLWYETRTLEWTFEFLPSGTLAEVSLNSPPDLDEESTRRRLNCDKPWPP